MIFTVFVRCLWLLAVSAFRRSKTVQAVPKTAPRRPQRAPRDPQDGPTGPQDGPSAAQEDPREGRRTEKSSSPPQKGSEGPNRLPKGTHEAPMRPSGGPKRPPKGPKGRPSGPNMAQRGFKPNVAQGGFPQDGSELGQDAFKRAPKQLQERLPGTSLFTADPSSTSHRSSLPAARHFALATVTLTASTSLPETVRIMFPDILVEHDFPLLRAVPPETNRTKDARTFASWNPPNARKRRLKSRLEPKRARSARVVLVCVYMVYIHK